MSGGALPALLAVAATWTVAGAFVLRHPSARVPGALAVIAGVLAGVGLVGVALAPSEGGVAFEGMRTLLVAAGLLAGPLAVATYPSPTRHTVDALALTVVAGAGTVAVIRTGDATVVDAMGVVSALTVVAHLWWKLERADPERRRALIWLGLGLAALGLVSFCVAFVFPTGVAAEIAGWLALGLVPVAMVVGVRLPEVVDARGIVVSAVVTGAALLACVSLYVIAASVVEIVRGSPAPVGIQALVAAGCAVTLQPMRLLLHGVVDDLLFGRRPDPLHAAARLAGGSPEDPAAAVHAIREALVLPYVAIRLRDAELVAAGHATPYTREIALPGIDGALVVGLRAGDLTLREEDLHVLRLTAPLVAQTLRSQAHAADLQQARAQTRTALEEERRRLRRDLHDGLGPRLSGIAFTADAAANLVTSDPAAARQLLGRVRAEAATAVDDIRRLVYGMRPPALDDLGLIGAIQQQVQSLDADSRRLAVTVDVVEDLPALPAAVEVAAYRIVAEALTNVARHSGSARATVTLRSEPGAIRVSVADEGRGVGPRPPWSPGVGLISMRERAEEIGGRLLFTSTPSGGLVEVTLPTAS